MITIVGIDPGIGGAIAAVQGHQLMAVTDMPAVDGRVSPKTLMMLIESFCPDVVVIEDLHAMPRGSIASFSLGYSMGICVAAVAGLSHPLVRLRANEWKKIQGLSGKDKNASRRLATERWPGYEDCFRRVKDDGRAEAALIADAYRRKEYGNVE